jgi:antitoxin Phd
MAQGPQMVTKRGAEAAVLVPVDEWRRLQAAARPSLKQLLLSDAARANLLIPARGSARRRRVDAAG